MKHLFSFLLVGCFLSLSTILLAQAPEMPRPVKKFIEFGFDIPNTAYLKEHHVRMQETTPFDGVIISLEAADAEGKKITSWAIMDERPWEAAWFDTAVAELKSCKFTTFTDNFIRLNFNPGRLDWDDDAGWKIFCDKSAIVAKISKDTGMKGVEINYETYGRKVFKYDPKSGRTFEEAEALARKRGREWMSAMVAEFPDMIFFALFFVELNLGAALQDDVKAALELSQYGLVPAFFNGVLDVTPPTVRIVDACEGGYYLNGLEAFKSRALCVLSKSGPAMRLIAPENRTKYARQIEVGFGFYLDMYTNPEGNKYYRGPVKGGTRLDRLRENLEGAWAATDEYVWIYGESYYWWKPNSEKRTKDFWENALPGTTRTIRSVKNPEGMVRELFEKLRATENPVNLLKNGDFTESVAGRTWIDGKQTDVRQPAAWSVWQAKVSRGTFTWDEESDGCAKASNTEWGCYLQKHPVRSNDYYYLSVDVRQQGEGEVSLSVQWQSTEGAWVVASRNVKIPFEESPRHDDGRPLREGWKRGTAIVRVPTGAAFLVVLPGIRDQKTAGDVVRFDDAVLYRLVD